MGEKSDSKKASSPYVVLENRPLDQWKVTELKEELKKRKLAIKGLKEDLVKRLDEAVRSEIDESNRNLEDDLNNEAQPDNNNVEDKAKNESLGDEYDNNVEEEYENKDVQMGMDKEEILQTFSEKIVNEGESGSVSTQVVEKISVETTVLVSEGMVSEELGNPNEDMVPVNEESKPDNQVDEVRKVKSDSISVDTISNTEKNDLKDNVIVADGIKLEVDVKPEVVQPSFTKSESVEAEELHKDAEKMDVCSENKDILVADDDVKNTVLDGGKSEPVAVDEVKITALSGDICEKNYILDVGSPEKLNLDRSSGDDSMDEDALESKQIDSNITSVKMGNGSEKLQGSVVKEDDSVDVVTADKNFSPLENKVSPNLISTKRKPHDQEATEKTEVVKRQRRWNSEAQVTNHLVSTTPKGTFQNLAKRTFSRSESTLDQESPKERVVPPSLKTPTTSLRIDNFLRPFTLKAVQELLGKTGTVVSYWMDQIKTHCYVTYASVEEAIETRNAVCNLQWPVNGGRLLMADFVDPQEVKNRVDPPLPPPPAAVQPPQPSPRLHVQKQQLPPPPPSLPPPPPSSNPSPLAREPPSPPPEKVDPPIVTLDDLFRKTRATPRIYYLPLTDEQVMAKMNGSKGNA